MYIFPVITVVIALTLPSALSLYWSASTLIMAIEQILIYRRLDKRKAQLEIINHP